MFRLFMYIIAPITLIFIWLFFMFVANDVYRYPCMDPVNWEKEECLPPQCEAMGLCTKYLIEIPGENTDDTQP